MAERWIKGENHRKGKKIDLKRETENVLKQLMTTQTAGEGSCLPINEALVLICHLDCTSELVRRWGKKTDRTEKGAARLDLASGLCGCCWVVGMLLELLELSICMGRETPLW